MITTWLMCLTNFAGFFNVNWKHQHAGGFIIIYAVIIACGYFVLGFYWLGRNWARWLVLLTSLLCLWNLWGLRLKTPPSQVAPVRTTMILAEAAVAVFLLWYLNTKQVRWWFSDITGTQPTSHVEDPLAIQ